MNTYRVKYFYFKAGAKAEYGFTIVRTESTDEDVIIAIAKEQAQRETRRDVRIMTISEI